jgi:hypothetical protein
VLFILIIETLFRTLWITDLRTKKGKKQEKVMNKIKKGNNGKKKNEIVYRQLDAYELEYVLITVADVIILTP